MNSEILLPRVGVGVWIKNQKGEVFLMKRKGSSGSGTWAPPGGKLDFGETLEDCAKREAKEESDLDIQDVKIIGVTNDFLGSTSHYVTIHTLATSWSGEPKNVELNKCSEIGWFSLENLPKPLFWTVENLIKTGQIENVKNA